LADGFVVDSDTLRMAAARFEQAADGIALAIPSFSTDSQLGTGDFGHTVAGEIALRRYEQQLQQAVEGLTALDAVLRRMGANLIATADNYDAHDQAAAGG
jgi:hypothetical protein